MKPPPLKGFPTREELLAWGMAPCAGDGCLKLVNPALLTYCKSCAQRRRRRR